MLLLAAAARPGGVEAATVDHGLRPQSAEEAVHVSRLCDRLSVPHATLRIRVRDGNLQSEARAARYAALDDWMGSRGLEALATAHHADDQAETLVMRLNRSSGLAGLAGIRARGTLPGSERILIRPLLGWRRDDLDRIVKDAGIVAADDASNRDPRYDRARLREYMRQADWLDVPAWGRSARFLADADSALQWAVGREWDEQVRSGLSGFEYHPVAPHAIRLRVVARIVRELGGNPPRGSAVERMIECLGAGKTATLGGVVASSRVGVWHFRRESRGS